VARRLFAGDRLVGALASGLQQDDRYAAEDFGCLCRRGGLLRPTVIRWTNRSRGTEGVYQVQRIEILYQFDKDYMDTLKKQHFR
jgi:hypothetical protein